MNTRMLELLPGFRLRPMRESDLDSVVAIEQSAAVASWTHKAFADSLSGAHDCDVVEQVLENADSGQSGNAGNDRNASKVVAFRILSRVLDEAHLLNIAVSSDFRRRGIAQALLNQMEAFCEAKDISMLYLEVRESNLGARELYGNQGFCETCVRKGYYQSADGPENAVLMMMELAPHK